MSDNESNFSEAEMESMPLPIRTRTEQNNGVLMEKIDNLANEFKQLKEDLRKKDEVTVGQKRKRKEKIEVPLECSEAVRRVYKALREGANFNGFEFKESKLSIHNSTTVKKVTEEVLARCGNKWPEYTIHGALHRYFKSLRDSHNRTEKGTASRHKERAKRRNAVVAKQKRRIQALEKIGWPERRIKKLRPVLEDLEYISSDEEGDPVTRTRKTRVLAWESSALAKYKSVLDAFYFKKVAKAKQLFMSYKQVKDDTCRASAREIPDEAVSWTLKQNNSAADDSNLFE